MSYRLESHRPRLESPTPRPSLPPLRIRSPGYAPSLTSPTTLLYDLPQSSTRSPPPQPDSPPLASPTPGRIRSRTRATPPPRSRSRSATPAQTTRQELDQFAAHCHAWYFDQDERAGQLMTKIVESLSASQRAPYSRLQASIRSKFHSTISKRRRTEFRAHLSSTNPGGSLSPSSRASPFGMEAKKERFYKFDRFIRTWCITGMPGTRPFFQGLWALMRLQVLPVNLGGAGSKRIQWEMDDAVFQESAGKEFMLEAIDIVKGVLGFEEYLSASSHQQSEELHSPVTATPVPVSPMTRPRSPSDPFLDTPALSHSVATYASRSPSNIPLPLSESDEMAQGPDIHELSASARTPPPRRTLYAPHKEPPDTGEEESLDGEPCMRLWTSPDLDNPELQTLISLFPEFITRHTLPRFPTTPIRRRGADLEEGLEITEETKEIRCGTGRMWVGDKQRREGWRGGWWRRFTGWWRRLFC